MSWFRKLLPPKIKREEGAQRKAVPEGLWSKCPSCEAVLYFTDLEKNLHVCPKCGFHNRLSSRQRLDAFLDPEGRAELASEVVPLDPLKFKDSRKYTERLAEAEKETGETDALVVMQGAVKSVPVIAAAFEFEFLGGSMGSVVGERFVRAVQACCDERLPYVCFTATGGARMQEGLLSLMQMAKTTAALHQLARRAPALHLRAHRSHDGRRLGELRDDRRRGDRRARRAGRLRRARASSSRPCARRCRRASSAPSSCSRRAPST